MAPGLILLAGTSESGKSSAGSYFAQQHHARRVKIRSILAELASGRPVTHEGVPMREGFDHQEFLTLVQRLYESGAPHALVIESFIDAELAKATRRAWTGPARIVFIAATRANRIARLTANAGISPEEAAAAIDRKDARKRVVEQWQQWRSLADDWIDNDGDYPGFLADLDAVLIRLTTDTIE
ncbi:hypothetical protein ABT297_24945 [Dactylosporangium sp. NPDC000555]|uniref:hypothetical protein n=1 Tax=Dactylosporangium sp. NPDC000555 TaxID=3154260 RepID=UPI00331A2069